MGVFTENSSFSQSTAFSSTARNSSYVIPGVYDLTVEDSNWVLTSSFIIFTMQTGKDFFKNNNNKILLIYGIRFLFRIWNVRVGMRFGKERGQHNDEERD